MSEYTEEEVSQWFFDQVEWIASKQRSVNLAACKYRDMTREQRIEFFNDVVSREHEIAGSPEMRTEEAVDFCRRFWNARDPRLIEGAGLHNPKPEQRDEAIEALHAGGLCGP